MYYLPRGKDKPPCGYCPKVKIFLQNIAWEPLRQPSGAAHTKGRNIIIHKISQDSNGNGKSILFFILIEKRV
jgi:hypothetical protein